MKRSTIIGLSVLLASTLAMFGFGAGCLFMLMLPSNGPPPITVNPIRAAVSPALTVEQKAVRDYFAYKYEADKIKIMEESRPVLYKKGNCVLVRVRYKMPSPYGGMLALSDDVFEIKNGKASIYNWPRGMSRYFTQIFDEGASADDPSFDYNQDN